MISVCVVDDHEVVRRGLTQILDETADIRVTEEATSGEELLLKLEGGRWDVTILDISLPGKGGLDALKELKARRPRAPVLMLTMHSEDEYAVRAFRLGADGYLTKERVSESLAPAVRRVAGGGKFITDTLAETLAREVEGTLAARPHDRLSDREYQALLLLAAGAAVGDVAAEMAVSVKTVSTFRTRILAKLGLRNNAELVAYALRHQLVRFP